MLHTGYKVPFHLWTTRECRIKRGSLAAPAYPVHALRRLQVMEAMAPDELDQDHRQKSGREELEDTVQDQIRAKEQEIRAEEQEIRGVEKEIAIASGTEVRKPLEVKLQFLRQEIKSCDQQNNRRDQQIISGERPHISESKRSVRKKLKIEGLGNEEFLEQVDVIRSAAGSKLEMISDLFQLVES